MLKKEFKKNDVERLRNLIKGKSNSRTSQGVGYTKSLSEDHLEGDTWEENGRSWTIKDGANEEFKEMLDGRQGGLWQNNYLDLLE